MDPNGIRKEPLMSDPFENTAYSTADAAETEGSQYTTLPEGWAAAVSPQDGRMYYYEKSTGKTSWTHPSVVKPAPAPYPPPAPVPPPAAPVAAPAPAPITAKNVLSTLSMESGASGIRAARSASDSVMKEAIRPKCHQCFSIVALIWFFPTGIAAVIYSMKVDGAWDAGRRDASIKFSRRALMFSRISVIIGFFVWMWLLFFRGPESLAFDFRPMIEW